MASDIKVNNIKSYTGNTLNLGDTGDTINLTGTSFNGTSSVIWDTTPKTTAFTATAGTGFFVDTTSGAITATLPSSPSAGDIVSFKDYAGTFGTNNLTIARNGENIQGNAENSFVLTNRASVVLVYVDATKGWLYTNESNVEDLGPGFVAATGGTITTSGDFKIHTFTSSGTFTVTNAGNPAGSTTVDYLVVAGGAGGASNEGGGGGAGGYRESFPNPATGGTPVSVQAYPITVGAGGAGGVNASNPGTNGSDSIFSTITSAGGGGGGGAAVDSGNGLDGGSGGGAFRGATIGSGNTPNVSPPQGNDGGTGVPARAAGGGGGANAAGGVATSNVGGNGGNGTTSIINTSSVTRAGGGGGGAFGTGGSGGTGGGGDGSGSNVAGTAGTANTGGGGGGTGADSPGASVDGMAGGSGVVIIRYKFQ